MYNREFIQFRITGSELPVYLRKDCIIGVNTLTNKSWCTIHCVDGTEYQVISSPDEALTRLGATIDKDQSIS